MSRAASNLPTRLIREARAMLREGDGRRINLRSLADRAGITAGSMYYHFSSKTELLGRLAAVGFNDLRRRIDRAVSEAPVGERLRVWARSYCDFVRDEPALFALMFQTEVTALPPVADAKAALIADLRTIVEEVAVAFGRRLDRLDEITAAVWAAAHGGAGLWRGQEPGPDRAGPPIDDVIVGLEALFMPDMQERP